jgi:glycosyltransferase involved in cell wall biosynthesis
VKLVLATGIYPPDIGGPATYVSRLAPDLAARGHGVEVVTYGATAQARSTDGGRGATFGISHVPRSRPLPLRYAAYLSAVRRGGRGAGVVYLQDPVSAGLPGLMAARSLGVPTLLKVVGDLAWEIGTGAGWVRDDIDAFQTQRYTPRVEWLRRAEHWVARHVDAVVVPSVYLYGIVRGWGVPAGRISVIENAPAPSAAAPSRDAARKALSLDTGLVVASAGRLVAHKGFDLLLTAAAELRRHVQPLTVVIAGDGPLRAALAAEVASLGLAETVRFPGTLSAEQMTVLRQASDVFVLLSSYEGRSHVLLEAMEAGLPIVASDIPGNRELLRDYADAALVPRESCAVVTALRRLAASPERRVPAGRSRTAGAWDQMVSRTLDLIERTCR